MKQYLGIQGYKAEPGRQVVLMCAVVVHMARQLVSCDHMVHDAANHCLTTATIMTCTMSLLIGPMVLVQDLPPGVRMATSTW